MHSAAATVVAAHARSASRPLNMQRIARMSAKTSTVQPMATLCMRNALRRWAPTASIPVHDRPLRCFSGTSAAASRRSFSSGDDIADPRLANGDPANNVPFDVARKEGHPLNIIKKIIEDHFADPENVTMAPFEAIDSLSPIVPFKQAFTELLIPEDHVSTRPQDTFYVDSNTVLRPHTSAHQNELMRAGHRAFLCTGDVYRRDTIDATHYPVFHQMEGVKIYGPDAAAALVPGASREAAVEACVADLKGDLEGMVRAIFGDVEVRWVEAYFPFTDPSLELEIYFNHEWLEVLGCGMVHRDLMNNVGLGDHHGYAFGLGLERLAMVLFQIPDIRLFWSDDPRFISQFSGGANSRFKPYSSFPACYKDITFWLTPEFHENDFFALVRTVAGDLVEDVTLVDEFVHPKHGKQSHCYRINYRSMDRSLTNAEVDVLQEEVRRLATERLGVELR